MERLEIKETVYGVIQQVLGVDQRKIMEEHHFSENLGAESIQSVEMMAGFEEAFSIEMDEDEAMGIQTVGGAIDYIKNYVRT